MDITVNNKRLKIMANIVPKVDVLGPELQYVPKKIEINKPLPDLKFVTPKVDNEGLQIVHLPKEVKVNKGLLKFDNLRTRIDNKGIDILRGPGSPTKAPNNQEKLFESLVPNYNTKFLQITKCSNFRRDPRLTPAPLLAWRVLRAHCAW